MAVTIKELSARCGLSVSTVSKALNDYPDVSEETRMGLPQVPGSTHWLRLPRRVGSPQ